VRYSHQGGTPNRALVVSTSAHSLGGPGHHRAAPTRHTMAAKVAGELRLASGQKQTATAPVRAPEMDAHQQPGVDRRTAAAPQDAEADRPPAPRPLRSPSSITVASTMQVSGACCAEPSHSQRCASAYETLDTRVDQWAAVPIEPEPDDRNVAKGIVRRASELTIAFVAKRSSGDGVDGAPVRRRSDRRHARRSEDVSGRPAVNLR
jgi:hypothetical protein